MYSGKYPKVIRKNKKTSTSDLTLKTEAACSSESSMNIYQTSQRHILLSVAESVSYFGLGKQTILSLRMTSLHDSSVFPLTHFQNC
jgi:hypothetical protein